MLIINYNQVLKEVKMKKAEIVKLKDKRRLLNVLDDETKAEVKIGNFNMNEECKQTDVNVVQFCVPICKMRLSAN